MSRFIASYKDESYPITINYIGLFALFSNLYETYGYSEAGILFSSSSREEAVQWAVEWGISEVTYNSTTGMHEVRIDMSPIESIMEGIATLFYPNADVQDLVSVLDILARHNVDIYDNNAVAEALKNGDIKKEIEEATGIKNYNDLYFSSAEYQAFQAGFDAQEQIIQTTMQTMTQKYNTAVSLVDNLYKILSSTISSCTETLKAYLTN
ncbi:IpaD/SipD/SspD family type III secretion system needle tip protein [Escherichia coli]|nr:IpaD/SipD/SspD family type III secretion system needle tip protein [Escherichia coli]